MDEYSIKTTFNNNEFRIEGGTIGGIEMTVPADDNKMTLTQAAAKPEDFRTKYLPAQNANAGAGASAGASVSGVTPAGGGVTTAVFGAPAGGGQGKQTKQRRMQRRSKQSRKKSKRGLKK